MCGLQIVFLIRHFCAHFREVLLQRQMLTATQSELQELNLNVNFSPSATFHSRFLHFEC